MATRSYIAKYNYQTGKYTAIYCHFDGYPQGVGKELITHFNTPDKVDELIQGYPIRSINDGIIERFNDTDEKESTIDLLVNLHIEALNHACEYLYLYDMNTNKWRFIKLELIFTDVEKHLETINK